MDLAMNLKTAREKAGYSQNDVAERLHISRQSISRWENGKSIPDIESLKILSKIYQMSLEDLVNGEKVNELIKNSDEQNDELTNTDYFLIVATALLSCVVPIIGLFINIGLIVYCYVKKLKLKSLYWLIICLCIIINISNAYTVLSVEIPTFGNGNIEKISKI